MIWLQPQTPRELGAALGRLKELHLRNISPEYNLSWTLFLLEAAPLLETLELHVFDHICRETWREKVSRSTELAWEPLSPGFRHRNLKEVWIHRALDACRDLPFARLLIETAVNLETLILGLYSFKPCQNCIEAEMSFPGLHRTQLRLAGDKEYTDAIDEKIKKLKHDLSNPVRIRLAVFTS
ncbi:hypothetical protein ACP4OV_001103 [Aristida adscensionis]